MRRLGERRAMLGVIAGLAAFVATGALAVTRDGGSASRGPALGPEGVPVPDAPVLAPARDVGRGRPIDGIACQRHEQILFHIHVHLSIAVRGRPRRIPAGIGIAPPREVATTPAGVYVLGGGCFRWLHTHAADGIVHVESPVARTYTLGELFDVWGVPLGPRRSARHTGMSRRSSAIASSEATRRRSRSRRTRRFSSTWAIRSSAPGRSRSPAGSDAR